MISGSRRRIWKAASRMRTTAITSRSFLRSLERRPSAHVEYRRRK
jgi:hypothetical protein